MAVLGILLSLPVAGIQGLAFLLGLATVALMALFGVLISTTMKSKDVFIKRRKRK